MRRAIAGDNGGWPCLPQNGHFAVIVLLFLAPKLVHVKAEQINSSVVADSDRSGIVVESYPEQHASLRIALVTETFPPEVNGVANTWGYLTRHLAQTGHSVQVVRPRQLYEESDVSVREQDQVLTAGFPIPSYPELRFGMTSAGRLAGLWRHRRPDLVHVATEGPLGWSAVSAARILRLPVTSSFHTNFQQYSRYYGAGLLKSAVETYLRKFHNRTMATLVPTQAMVRALRERGYRDVALMSRGVATEQFSPAARSRELRAAWGASDDDLVVLYVGRLAKEKSVHSVIAAYLAIKAVVRTAKLVLVGDGPLRETLQANCPHAIFCGVKKGEALAQHYASGDLFLFPSVTETFGNVVPEAMASGLAVVSYNCAAAAELITDGQSGVLVERVERVERVDGADSGDEAQFIRVALALARQPNRLVALRRRAAPSVTRLRWPVVTQALVNTWHSVIARHEQASFSDSGLRTALATPPINPVGQHSQRTA